MLSRAARVGDKLISVIDPLDTWLEGKGDGASGVERVGEVIGLAVTTAALALFVGGMAKLIRFRRGECDRRGELSSNRMGLIDLGELYSLLLGTGLGMASFDSRSTRVSFASPRDAC
jgi:hypothetical protein